MLFFRACSLFGPTSRGGGPVVNGVSSPSKARTMLSLTAINFGATVTSTPVAMNGVLYFSARKGCTARSCGRRTEPRAARSCSPT